MAVDIGIRAARNQLANERIAVAAPVLVERFGVEFDLAALSRFDHDAANRALFFTEGVADLLDAIVAQTAPPAEAPPKEAPVADRPKDAPTAPVRRPSSPPVKPPAGRE